jgi:Kef-type K+ transport system membrane component KefB
VCSPSSSPSPRRLGRGNRIERILEEGEHATSQTTLRFSIVLLLFLLAVAARFGLDVVLGAFLAGMVLRRWAPGDVHSLEGKLDAVGYGFFIPVFFVVSGMNLDVHSIIEAPLRLVTFFVLLLLVRGLPALLVYRWALPMSRSLQICSSPPPHCRCWSRCPRSGCGTGRCCGRTPPLWSAQGCCL